jgi:hypothetical protein
LREAAVSTDGDATVTAIFALMPPGGWEFQIDAMGGLSASVRFGMCRGATDGLDTEYDRLAPEVDPQDGFAALHIPMHLLVRDIRAPKAEDIYRLEVSAPAGASVTLSWDSEHPMAGLLAVEETNAGWDPLPGGANFGLDEQQDFEVEPGATLYLRIVFTAWLFDVELFPRWNLVSLPIQPLDPFPPAVFAGLQDGPVWRWNNRASAYVVLGEAVPPDAWWVYVSPETREKRTLVQVAGIPTREKGLEIHGRWGLGGPTSAPPYRGLLPPLKALPQGAATCTWGWDPDLQRYMRVTEMPPGIGRWIVGNEPCNVDLRADQEARDD